MTWQMILTAVLLVLMTVSMVFRIFPTSLNAMLVAIILACCGIIEPKAAFSPLANTTSVLVVTTGILGAALFNTGVATKLARAIIKITGTSENGIMLCVMFVSMALSAFCSGVSVVLIMLPIVVSLCTEAKVSVSRMLIPLSYAASIGCTLTLVGAASTVSGVGLIKEMGIDFIGFFEWAKVGIPLCIVFSLYMIFIGKKLLKPGDSADPEFVARYTRKDAIEVGNGHTKAHAIISVLVLLAVVVAMAADLDAFPMYFVAAIGCIVLRVTGCMTQKELLSAIDLKTVLIVGGMTAVASGVKSSGLGAWIADSAVGLLGDNPSKFAMLAVVMIVTVILTNVLSNTACVALLIPLFIPIAQNFGINPIPIGVAICVGGSIPFLMPIGSGTNSTLVSPGNLTVRDFFVPGIGLTILSIAVALIMIPIAWPL